MLLVIVTYVFCFFCFTIIIYSVCVCVISVPKAVRACQLFDNYFSYRALFPCSVAMGLRVGHFCYPTRTVYLYPTMLTCTRTQPGQKLLSDPTRPAGIPVHA